MTSDISPESVRAFVEKWDSPVRHTGERMTDSPLTPFGEAMLMLTALSADRDSLRQQNDTMVKVAAGRERKLAETCRERDALKVKLARLVEAALGYRRVTWQKEWTMRSPQFLMDDNLMAAIDASRETP